MKHQIVIGTLVLASSLLSSGATASERFFGGAPIIVHETHYMIGNSVFDDLDSLERSVLAASPRSIELHACGSESSRALLAAAHRFSRLPLRLRVSDASAAVCAPLPTMRRVGQPAFHKPNGIDDLAVANYWRQMAP